MNVSNWVKCRKYFQRKIMHWLLKVEDKIWFDDSEICWSGADDGDDIEVIDIVEAASSINVLSDTTDEFPLRLSLSDILWPKLSDDGTSISMKVWILNQKEIKEVIGEMISCSTKASIILSLFLSSFDFSIRCASLKHRYRWISLISTSRSTNKTYCSEWMTSIETELNV